jgi:hypothetical protein
MGDEHGARCVTFHELPGGATPQAGIGIAQVIDGARAVRDMNLGYLGIGTGMTAD